MSTTAVNKADVGVARELSASDLDALCEAAEAAILDGGGFGWLSPPPRDVMQRYWRGVLLVPERTLYVGRIDGQIAGSAQLVRPPRNNEAQAFAATVTTFFVAPWGRGGGLSRMLMRAVEDGARAAGFHVLQLDVRETQDAAIALYESLGFECWGTNPAYAMVEGKLVAGHFYAKRLKQLPGKRKKAPKT